MHVMYVGSKYSLQVSLQLYRTAKMTKRTRKVGITGKYGTVSVAVQFGAAFCLIFYWNSVMVLH